MKLLLTSSGTMNVSIQDALVELLGKPIAHCNALAIPTGVQPFPGGPQHVHRFLTGPDVRAGVEVAGSAGVDRTAEHQRGVLGVGGSGDRRAAGLGRQSDVPLLLDAGVRLADLLPSLRPEVVYVGTSGGAMVATPDWGGLSYDGFEPLTGSDQGLGLVDFSVFPHLDRKDGLPPTPQEEIEAWAAGLSVPAYVIDDDTAIKVVDGVVEVVSEGRWQLLS